LFSELLFIKRFFFWFKLASCVPHLVTVTESRWSHLRMFTLATDDLYMVSSVALTIHGTWLSIKSKTFKLLKWWLHWLFYLLCIQLRKIPYFSISFHPHPLMLIYTQCPIFQTHKNKEIKWNFYLFGRHKKNITLPISLPHSQQTPLISTFPPHFAYMYNFFFFVRKKANLFFPPYSSCAIHKYYIKYSHQ
jgi:hypothetical protein